MGGDRTSRGGALRITLALYNRGVIWGKGGQLGGGAQRRRYMGKGGNLRGVGGGGGCRYNYMPLP